MFKHTFNQAVHCYICWPYVDRGCLLPEKMREKQLTLEELWHYVEKWKRDTFGDKNEGMPIAAILHLQKEVKELLDEPYELEEYTDVFSMLVGAAIDAGFTVEQFRKKACEKFLVNLGRKWNTNVPDGQPIEHVRDQQPPTLAREP